ncbi:MAG: hypothetical protein AB7K09_17920 [Planctomycetota bacterium]
MERGHISTSSDLKPVTTDLPASDGSWVEVTAAAVAGVVAIGVSAAHSIMWIFADSSSDADTDHGNGNYASYRGDDINYEIPCAGRGAGKPNLYIRALSEASGTTAGISYWAIAGCEG